MVSWGKWLLVAANILLWLPSGVGLMVIFRLMWLKPHPGDIIFLRWRKRITLAVLGIGLAEIALVKLLHQDLGWVVAELALYFVIAFLAVPKCSQMVRNT